MDWIHVVAGFFVGALVGLTGVGGGSLLTPLLVLVFGVSPTTAVGTDLLFAGITKAWGTLIHAKSARVDWPLVAWLAVGSVPAAGLTVLVLHYLAASNRDIGAIITPVLGFMLILTACALLAKSWLISKRGMLGGGHAEQAVEPRIGFLPVATLLGAALGVLVTLSSIGAGALGVVALLLLRPAMPLHRVVGSDIAHAVPLALIGGLGYASMQAVDWRLLLTLLMGSLPGIWVGSHLAHRLPERTLRYCLATILLILGFKFVY